MVAVLVAAAVHLLFDLDGTLTDPLLGISRCLSHAVVALGRSPPDLAGLARFVGPPLRATFAELLETDDKGEIERAVAAYRERFGRVGLYENAVYPGIPDALEALAAAGHRQWVVTSKPHPYARRIVGHFGLESWFEGVYGAELDGRNSDKADLVRLVVATEGLDPAATWMIGDRDLDVRGGRSNGTRTAGVLWGYGTLAELAAAGPDLLVARPDELVGQLQGAGLATSEQAGP